MARPLKNLKCPFCHQTRTSRQAGRPNARLETPYECVSCGHRFTTVETVTRAELTGLRVLAPPTPINPNPRPALFDLARLEAHLRWHLRKRLTAAQRERLAHAVVAELAEALPRIPRVTDQPDGPVEAKEIRKVVSQCLRRAVDHSGDHEREHYAAAHVMYAMTAAHAELPGILEFISARYPTAVARRIPPAEARLGDEHWHYSQVLPAPEPTMVVKNFRPAGQGDAVDNHVEPDDRAAARANRPRETFARNSFELSIDRALGSTAVEGTQSLTKEEAVRNISEWVLWSLAGQPVVRSSQLAALTAQVLRRCAPLAYLRWVSIGKELSVAEIYQEGCGLLEVPSIPLVFDPAAAAVALREQPPAIRHA